MNWLTYPTEIGVRFVFQLVPEVTIMQVMLTLILQQNEIDPQSKLIFTFVKIVTSQKVLLGSSQFCLWWIHGQDMHMQNLSNPRTPRRLEVQFQNLLEVWVMLVRLKFVETMRMFWSVAWNFSSRLELVKALARQSRPIATTARIALAFVNEQFRLSAICRRHW